MTYPVKHISISINRSKPEVYAFVSNPERFPDWLGFMKSIAHQSNTTWIAQTDVGELTFEMPMSNAFGVVDHDVKQADGSKIKNILRVIENGEGSEVMFTVLQTPDKTLQDIERDVAAVQADLAKLKEILEQ